ncbi:putative manganese efflux pump MntP [Corynebacterium provencense]|uniref:Putative manganese efflux pump MntP n=1 Tax=Corynebacterium provencense TaxID=1737425 RepID=A0A2Z3YQA8_9CORY|nr:manganese efflux pump MntP family protein [Corynebacterium provencense]AWT27082.1 putative manganese efflux pump MntP [Corynebacterium provencense]
MSLWSVFVIGVGVSADAVAASLTTGVRMRTLNYFHALVTALVFAVFQTVMPLLGWFAASRFSQFLAPVDHWIAFGLLSAVGAKMTWDALHPGDDSPRDGRLDLGRLLLLGLATSIDAAAVGVSFAVLDVSVISSVLIIAATTLTLSLLAVLVGHKVGVRFRTPAEIIGGLVLVAIGVRIILEHFLGG